MNPEDIEAIAFVVLFFGGIALVTGLLAKRKGYKFWTWLFAGGIIGLVALAYLPYANGPNVSELEQRGRAERGNSIGRKMVVLNVALVLLRAMVHS